MPHGPTVGSVYNSAALRANGLEGRVARKLVTILELEGYVEMLRIGGLDQVMGGR